MIYSVFDNFYVLFVDDEPKATRYFDKMYNKEFKIITAGNSQDAWQIMKERENEIGVVVSDQRMPNGTGVELLSKVQREYPHIIRILTTAYADLEDNIKAINQSHIFSYMTKPWKHEEIKPILYKALTAFKTNLCNSRIRDLNTSQPRKKSPILKRWSIKSVIIQLSLQKTIDT